VLDDLREALAGQEIGGRSTNQLGPTEEPGRGSSTASTPSHPPKTTQNNHTTT